ncbi:MAG TPA: G8 domain-containing protein, partial [Bacteroidia bacterium]|nr:G8 domain-containing protein [Bacteroidia bacterium]
MKQIHMFKLLLFFLLSAALPSYSLTFYSIANTGWNTPSTWSIVSCGGPVSLTTPGSGDDVVICSGTTVLMDGNAGLCNSLTISGTANWASSYTTNVGAGGVTINPGGNITGSASGVITTTGGLVNNSTLTSTSVTIKIITTPNQVISGTGSLARLDISANTTNNGSLTITTALTSTTPSILTQAVNSTLIYNGTSSIAPTLVATASGNTVTYGGTTQMVKSTTYQNLTISGSGIKTLEGNITVNGNLLIDNNSHLYTSLFQITGNATGT